MKHLGTATPYVASYVLVRKENKIAFVLRSNTTWMNNYYGLPAGKVEKNESFTSGAMREAKEEVGIDVDSSELEHVLTMHRKESGEKMEWVDVFFEVLHWEGEPYNAEPHMHGELAWLDPLHLPKNVIPSVSYALENIQKGNTFCEYGWH